MEVTEIVNNKEFVDKLLYTYKQTINEYTVREREREPVR